MNHLEFYKRRFPGSPDSGGVWVGIYATLYKREPRDREPAPARQDSHKTSSHPDTLLL
jgi:hypothetical protein